MSKSFKEYAKSRELEVNDFPHARLGRSFLKMIIRLVKTTLVLFVIGFVISQLPVDPDETFGESLPDDRLREIAWVVASGFLHTLDSLGVILNTVCYALIVLIIALIAMYIVNVMMRWRAYERECLKSDWIALRLRHRLLKAMKIRQRMRSLSRQISNAGENSDTSSYTSRLEALRLINQMMVQVNVRESLDTDAILRYYMVSIELPSAEDEYDELMKYMKAFSTLATRVARGKVSFGEMEISSDRSRMWFSDAVAVLDKYRREVEEVVEDEIYEYSFPLTLLVDWRQEIAEKVDAASVWAERTGQALDKLFATKNTAAKRLKTKLGAASVMYEYEMSFNLNINGMDKMGSNIDSIFKTSGTSVQIVNGNLQIVIAVPKEYALPIDVGEMYRKVFGRDA